MAVDVGVAAAAVESVARAAGVDAPTRELGAPTHVSPWSQPILDEREANRDLAWPQNVRDTYPWMLNDAQVEGLYRGLVFPIHGYEWWLDPNGAPQTAVDRISADYNLPVGRGNRINQRRSARRFIFDEHLEDALRAPSLGHYAFEQVYEVARDGPPGLNGGWVAHLRKLAARPPATISEIRPARDGGLEYIRVPALEPGQNAGSVLGLLAGGGVQLPVDRLVMYVWDREGANWSGRSMLRSCYRPWKLKDRVLRVGAINIERAGGVPYIEAPEGATAKHISELHQLAAAFRVGESAGAALPHGAQLKFAQAAGQDAAINYIRLQNEEMARAWVQMIQMLGQTETGSRALGETFEQRANVVEQRVAEWFAGIFNRHVIEDDVELNEGATAEYAPLLRFAPRGNPVDELAGALDDAQREGALPPDSETAAAVRAAAGERRATRRPAQPRAAELALPDRPLRRQPYPHEVQAAVDFEQLETDWTTGQDDLVTSVQDAQADQVDELHAQVIEADGDLSLLAALAATPIAVSILAGPALDLIRRGRDSALAEAGAQGATVPDPDLATADEQVQARAQAEADLLARAISESAARRAVALSAGGTLTAEETADQVREHLDGLSDAFLRERLGGVATQAQNAGRKAVWETEPPQRIYASELLDGSTCSSCTDVDGEEYESLDDFARDYPSGGYVGCEGGERCRGTGVAVYDESAPTDA